MGFYIEVEQPTKKAQQLCRIGAEVRSLPSFPPPQGKVLICVLENGFFDAAGICYDQKEFNDFNDPKDTRPKTWLHMDRAQVIALEPRVEEHLIG